MAAEDQKISSWRRLDEISLNSRPGSMTAVTPESSNKNRPSMDLTTHFIFEAMLVSVRCTAESRVRAVFQFRA